MAENNWFKRNIAKRELIKKNEEKVTYLQIIGFSLIGIGILYMTAFRIIKHFSTPEGMAISFFLIMLGMAFAFPSLLQGGDKEMSTMRIVVFMTVNVICLLLIKTGWGNEIKSLKDVGLDQYWMGVIAFIFGAKATQAFFESRVTRQSIKNEQTAAEGNINTIFDSSIKGNPQLAINANRETLLKKYPMIKKLIASYYFDGIKRLPCVDICISGNAKGTLPDFLEYKQADGSVMRIKTRVIINYNNVKPQVGRGHFIANDNTRAFLGTACCILEGDDPERRYLLTCNHVMTAGKFEDISKPQQKAVRFFSANEFDEVGTWEFGKMNDTVDAAIIDIEKTERIEPNDIDSTIYIVTEDDCSQTEVELKGAFSKTKRAFIIHIDQPIDVDYKNETVTMNGLVTLSVDLDHFNFTPPTRKGDSGALVYHAHTRQPIGMVIGANTQFTFVVPLMNVLNAFPELKLKLLNS
jgi:hypothetical protein